MSSYGQCSKHSKGIDAGWDGKFCCCDLICTIAEEHLACLCYLLKVPSPVPWHPISLPWGAQCLPLQDGRNVTQSMLHPSVALVFHKTNIQTKELNVSKTEFTFAPPPVVSISVDGHKHLPSIKATKRRIIPDFSLSLPAYSVSCWVLIPPPLPIFWLLFCFPRLVFWHPPSHLLPYAC